MHSSGRGEESPEPYRGVVLPSAQHQPQQPVQGPYGGQVPPAGGGPRCAPASPPALPPPGQAPGQPPPPEPAEPPAGSADATQALPLSIFEEPKPYEPEYPQQGYGQEYGGDHPQHQQQQ